MPHLKRTLKIVAVCLAVGALLLLRRPPKPSDAAITGVEEELLQRVPAKQGPKSEVAREWLSKPKEDFVPRAEDASAVGQVLQSQPAGETTLGDTLEAGRTAKGYREARSPNQVRVDVQGVETPVGVVDARNCIGLNYNQIMRGAVSTRMVWNGHTFVPQKVCVVKEGDSVASVWSFEQSSGALVSELGTDSRVPSTAAQK